MNNIAYSHRPIAGVSVAAVQEGGKLYFAASIVNNGYTLSGNYEWERHDVFSRAQARKILNGRLEKMMEEGEESHMGFVFETDMGGRSFIAKFRQVFKPDYMENDDILYDVMELAGTKVSGRKEASDIWNIVADMANTVVAEYAEVCTE